MPIAIKTTNQISTEPKLDGVFAIFCNEDQKIVDSSHQIDDAGELLRFWRCNPGKTYKLMSPTHGRFLVRVAKNAPYLFWEG